MVTRAHKRFAIIPLTFLMSLLIIGQVGAQTAGLRLVGTIGGGKLAGAVFQDTTGQQIFFQIQEKLPDGSKIVKIREESILLKGEDGSLYDMFIARDTRTVSTVPQRNDAVLSTPPREDTTQSKPLPVRRRRHLPPEED